MSFVASVEAAAEMLGPGPVRMPEVEAEIYDRQRRTFPIADRIYHTPATGHPTLYVEQTGLGRGSFSDPRNIAPTRVNHPRDEKPAFVKAIVAQFTVSLFDTLRNQMKTASQEIRQAQDLNNTLDGVTLTHAQGIWTGTDTTLALPTSVQYVGLLNQITQTFSIAQGASIEQGLMAEVATMISSTTYAIKPSGIYMNPVLANLLAQEVIASKRVLNSTTVGGLVVSAISTGAGEIPIISDPSLASTVVLGVTQYPVVILSEADVEYHWMGDEKTQVYRLGLISNLASNIVAVKFGCPIAKGATYAHSYGTVLR